MHAQPTAPAAGLRPRRGTTHQTALAPLPDPSIELKLAAGADTRARQKLATAAAAGEPLLDPSGRRRSPITLPEYREGRAPANKGKRYPAEILTANEIAALLDAFPARTAFGARQRALVVVLWRAGLRIAEALALAPKDVDPEQGAIVILSGKGAKRRVVGIDKLALSYLAEWTRERAALDVPTGAPLFCTISRDAGGVGRPLKDSTVRESLKSYAKRAGITRRVHPHGLRHTHAYELATEGQPVHLIRAQLGHIDLETTQRYIDHLAPQTLLTALRDRAWPGTAPVAAVTRVAKSQGLPARSEPDRATAETPADRPLPPSKHSLRVRAATGVTKREIMRLIAANGGRVTQRQLSRALRMRPATVHRHCYELAAAGHITWAGKTGQPPSNVWALPALAVTFKLQPHARVGSVAVSGGGQQRVLEAVTEAGGRASQAQLAGMLGLSPSTISKHCQLLEGQGMLERGGLDKSTSNRGSLTWRLPSRQRWTTGGNTLRVPAGSTSTRRG